MPTPNTMRIKYLGEWSEVEIVDNTNLDKYDKQDIISIGDKNFTIGNIVMNTGYVSGYSIVTFTDYLLKVVSTLSPAYEATIDELMFSKGADTVPIIMKATWVPKFPFVYTKKYVDLFKSPNNGPLNEVKDNLIQHMK